MLHEEKFIHRLHLFCLSGKKMQILLIECGQNRKHRQLDMEKSRFLSKGLQKISNFVDRTQKITNFVDWAWKDHEFCWSGTKDGNFWWSRMKDRKFCQLGMKKSRIWSIGFVKSMNSVNWVWKNHEFYQSIMKNSLILSIWNEKKYKFCW